MDAPPRRGTGLNPANRFEELSWERDESADPAEEPTPGTVFYRDASRSALTRNDSPDIPFTWSLNPYRGCEHGCPYCFARPTHEYLGLSAGLDFETKVMVKTDAPELLARELARPSWAPEPIALGTATDCYQPAERRFEVTRRCLRVLADCRHPCGFVTKSALVLRDLDLLSQLSAHGAVRVFVTLTTLDAELARALEPRAAAPAARLRVLRELSAAGVPVGVMAAPMIPGLNDHELAAIVEAAAAAGAGSAAFIPLRLPHGVGGIFEDWLSRAAPGRRLKVLSQVRDMRGGRLNDPRFGHRMRGEGAYADNLRSLFRLACRRHGLDRPRAALRSEAFRRPEPAGQLRLL